MIVSVDTSVWIAFLRRRAVAHPLPRLLDAHLLASAEAERHTLWTLDGDLARAAKHLGVAFIPLTFP